MLFITCANLAGALLSRAFRGGRSWRSAPRLGRGAAASCVNCSPRAPCSRWPVARRHCLASVILDRLRDVAARRYRFSRVCRSIGALCSRRVCSPLHRAAFGVAPALSVDRSNAESTLHDEPVAQARAAVAAGCAACWSPARWRSA